MENFGNFMPPEDFSQQMLNDLEGKSSGRKGKIVAIVIGLIVVAAVAGLGIWYWANHNDRTTETAQGSELEEDGKGADKVGSIGDGKVDYPENPNGEDKDSDEDETEEDKKNESDSSVDNGTTTKPAQPTQETPVEKGTVTISLEENGAKISAAKVVCEKNGAHCKVKLPTITREGWEVLGWGENKDATSAKYKSGAEISVSANMTLYAVTKKVNTFKFEKNGAQAVGKESISCEIHNKETSCAIKLPTITREGWEILGWSQEANPKTAQFKVGDVIYTSNSRTLYAVTGKKLQ